MSAEQEREIREAALDQTIEGVLPGKRSSIFESQSGRSGGPETRAIEAEAPHLEASDL
jgi:hypothetical protein